MDRKAREEEVPEKARIGLGGRRLLLVKAPENDVPSRAGDRDGRPLGFEALQLAPAAAAVDQRDELVEVEAVASTLPQPAVLRILARGEIEAEEVAVLVEISELCREDALERLRERSRLGAVGGALQAREEVVHCGSDRLLDDLVPGQQIQVESSLRDAVFEGDVVHRRLLEPRAAVDAQRRFADLAAAELLDYLLLGRHKWN